MQVQPGSESDEGTLLQRRCRYSQEVKVLTELYCKEDVGTQVALLKGTGFLKTSFAKEGRPFSTGKKTSAKHACGCLHRLLSYWI